MTWRILADAVLVLHLAFILFAALGGLLVLRWPLVAWIHLPAVAWGSLRFGLGPELFALATLVNGAVFFIFAVMYILMRYRIVSFGYRGP